MPEIIKHAILIGINEVPHLQYLDTPSNYAIQMRNWARDQGYNTYLFVDQPEGEETGICNIAEIKKVIRKIIEDGTDQLLVYFSGHGVEHTAANDVWLLPDYQNDPDDCISISLNKALAYTSGIPHVIFISDSCRVPSDHKALKAASGSAILPNLDKLNPDTEVDVLYSTWPGQPAVDIKNNDGTYRSIYSDHLLSCLNGNVPEVIKQIQNLAPGFPAVLSDELGRFLKKIVPTETAAAGAKRQFPMSDVTSRDPLHLSKFDIGTPTVESAPEGNLPSVSPPGEHHEIQTVSSKLQELVQISGANIDVKTREIVNNFRRAYNDEYDNDFFTSPNTFSREQTGLMVSGLLNPVVFSKRPLKFRYRNFAIPQILDYDEAYNILDKDNIFIIGNPRTRIFYPVTILDGFFTQVVFEKGKLLTVNYFPTTGWRREQAHRRSGEIARRKATIIAAAKNGIFLGDEEIAGFLRRYKNLDPTFGLFAAYAYYQKGNFEGVRSIYHIMQDEPEPVLGDIKILGKLSGVNLENIEHFDVPIPMLTEGWSYLKLLPENPYSYLSTQLEPGLWTAINRTGLGYLRETQNYRKL